MKRTHLFAARNPKIKHHKMIHGWNAKGGGGGFSVKSSLRRTTARKRKR